MGRRYKGSFREFGQAASSMGSLPATRLRTGDCADSSDDFSNGCLIATTRGQQVDVACTAVGFLQPNGQQSRSFQDAPVAYRRRAKAIKESFTGVTSKQKLELHATFFRLVVQAVSDRCRKIPDHRTPNSRAVLNRREGSSSSVRIRASTVTLRSRRPSCNASRAASRPIRRSNRKQSTIVRAGEVMRAGTPLNTASRTPYVQAAPLKRTRRVRICGSRGGLALW